MVQGLTISNTRYSLLPQRLGDRIGVQQAQHERLLIEARRHEALLEADANNHAELEAALEEQQAKQAELLADGEAARNEVTVGPESAVPAAHAVWTSDRQTGEVRPSVGQYDRFQQVSLLDGWPYHVQMHLQRGLTCIRTGTSFSRRAESPMALTWYTCPHRSEAYAPASQLIHSRVSFESVTLGWSNTVFTTSDSRTSTSMMSLDQEFF